MEPSKQLRGSKDCFGERMDVIIDPKSPLARLVGPVPWSDFEARFGRFYQSLGRPAP